MLYLPLSFVFRNGTGRSWPGRCQRSDDPRQGVHLPKVGPVCQRGPGPTRQGESWTNRRWKERKGGKGEEDQDEPKEIVVNKQANK